MLKGSIISSTKKIKEWNYELSRSRGTGVVEQEYFPD
jgi:hypothetical protein